jgi:hypothetical protein
MRRFRFHLRTLVILVLLLGVGFAALRESNEIWDSGVFALTLGILLTSVLLAIHRTESRRAFWLGFALFGWIYLGLTLLPSMESRLITTKAIAYLDSKVPGRSTAVYTVQLAGTGSGSPGNQVQKVSFIAQGNQLVVSGQGGVKLWDAATGRLLGGWTGKTDDFMRIGHTLFALLAGWVGGFLSCRLWRASRPPGESMPGLS